MNITFEDVLKHSFVIDLENKTQQYEYFAKCFKSDFQNLPMPKRFEGFSYNYLLQIQKYNERVSNVDKMSNARMSHIALIKMAKCLDYPYILIFESDVKLNTQYSIEDINQVLSKLPNDVHGLTLGYYKFNNNHSSNTEYHIKLRIIDDVFMRSDIWGAHAYIVFKNGYDQMIQTAHKIYCTDHLWDFDEKFLMTRNNYFIQKRVDFNQSVTRATV